MNSQDISSLWEKLLPGIPDDVALDEIATKIAAKDVGTLSLVSPRWRQEIQHRVVYNSRLRRRSTDSHVVLRVLGRGFNGFCLYSLSDHTLHQLPRVPNRRLSYQFVALDGKLYVLGGESWSTQRNPENDSRKVFVLDLAGQQLWKERASMLQPRREFGCGVMDGKIYVFGGSSVSYGHQPGCATEVYDPKVDAWFPLKCRPTGTRSDIVIPAGEELFVKGPFLSSFQVYHAGKDQWRVVELRGDVFKMFIFRGEFYTFYTFGSYGIDVYDHLSWRHRCSITCDELGPIDTVVIFPKSILPVNNELLANVNWRNAANQTEGDCLLLSSGFGSEGQDVVWRKAPCRSFESRTLRPLMCLVEL